MTDYLDVGCQVTVNGIRETRKMPKRSSGRDGSLLMCASAAGPASSSAVSWTKLSTRPMRRDTVRSKSPFICVNGQAILSRVGL